MSAQASRFPSSSTPPHSLDPTQVFTLFETSPQGLSNTQAQERLVRFGANRLTPPRGRSAWQRFLAQFRNVLIYVLLGAAFITALLSHWVDTGVIIGVVVINALIGFLQEGKAEKALEAIKRLLSLKTAVLRSGHLLTLPAENLVPGDVVLIQSGDRVPADLRLFRVKSLRVEESSLTGESLPVEKDNAPVAAAAPLGDRRGMAYSGTLVTYGQAHGVVVATGDTTELGRISEMLTQVQRLDTPLIRKMADFARGLSLAILVLAVGTFLVGVLLRGYSLVDMFLAAVGIAVAAIPEGLPAIMTITLAIGVQRMARSHAIIRVLPAVEALGSVTCICSDKTGTLTRNEMTVQAIATAEYLYSVSGVGYAPTGEFSLQDSSVQLSDQPLLQAVLHAGLLCNDAGLHKQDERWLIDGDPTEGALVVAAVKAGFDAALENEHCPRTDVIPFESEHRFMATLHHDHQGRHFIYIKGAPEKILGMCSQVRTTQADLPLEIHSWHKKVDQLAAQGLRVLALAYKSVGPEHTELQFTDVDSELTLLGLVGMADPPREEAIRAVAACHTAGIRVMMITGDHAVTAVAVAARLGIGDGQRALSGVELERLDDAALRRMVSEVDVYARVSPEHKLRLVQALQARGEIVAMTGDGVNDAPALKRADVGVAMGITGTEVAKEAAEMVLADDNFASIVHAVKQGRTVYDNLRKTILFILPTSGGEAATLVLAIFLGMVLPLLPVQILWVNMITAVTLSLALAFEPHEPASMQRPPRDPRTPIFSAYFLWRTLFVTGILTTGTLGMFIWEQARGVSVELARTAAVNTLVMFEVFYLLNARYLTASSWPWTAFRGNYYIPFTIVLVIIFQLLYTYTPFMQLLFHSAALDIATWLRILLVSSSVYFLVEFEKWLTRTLGLRVS